MTDVANFGSPDRLQGLRSLGEADFGIVEDWPDYVARFGLGRDDVPSLVALAREVMSLDEGETYDALKAWAPVHGWRALAQLRAIEAIPVLIEIGLSDLDDDAVVEDLPLALAMFGAEAMPALRNAIEDPSLSQSATMFLAGVLPAVAEAHPDQRATCIEMLTAALAPDSTTNDVGKGFVVSALLDLKAVEAIEPMRHAFKRKAVDLSMAGDIEEVEIALGLRTMRSTPRPNFLGNRFKPLFRLRQALAASAREVPRPGGLSPVRTGAKIGRNDPCPCGSGKKYKKCCLAGDETSAGFR